MCIAVEEKDADMFADSYMISFVFVLVYYK